MEINRSVYAVEVIFLRFQVPLLKRPLEYHSIGTHIVIRWYSSTNTKVLQHLNGNTNSAQMYAVC